MHSKTLKYSLLVFLGGASYGVMATTVKLALAKGFLWNQVVVSQTTCGFVLFIAVFLVATLLGKKPKPMTRRQILRLLGTGMVACTTTILYGFSLTMLPVAVSLTLLFQFTWIGVVIQIITTRRTPYAAEIIAVLVIFGGTLFASGFFDANLAELNPIGLVCALLSAVSCALFMFLSSRVETDYPALQRGLFISCGTAIMSLTVCPDYFVSGALQAGIWKQGFILGFFGFLVPIILFGIGTPHLPTGLSTIMASSELPSAIIISILVLNEPISVLQIGGVISILGGVVISQIPNLRKRDTS